MEQDLLYTWMTLPELQLCKEVMSIHVVNSSREYKSYK
jgi:hypothetical protein